MPAGSVSSHHHRPPSRTRMNRRILLTITLLFVRTVMVASDVEPRTVVVKLRAGSDVLRQWQGAGRTGTIDVFSSVLGGHSSAPYVSDATLRSVERAHERNSNQRRIPLRDRPIACIAVLRFERDADPTIMARKLASLPDVEWAEPLPIRKLVDTPNDPEVSKQTHLPIVKAFESWDHLPSAGTVVVGIVDTGIDTTHPDIAANIWRNPGETGVDGSGRDKRSNGIDDDANGFVDD